MFIDCWSISDEEYQKLKNNCLLFVKDVGADALCICGFCKKEILISATTTECCHCGNDLIYGRFDW